MKQYLNLLPQSVQRRLILRDRLAAWSLVWLALAVAAGLWHWSNLREYQTRLAAANGLNDDYQRIVRLRNEVAQVRGKIGRLQQRESTSLLLADDLPSLLIVAIVSQAARDSGGAVCVQNLAFSRAAVPNSGVGGVQQTLELSGLGLDNLAVARFVASLRDSQLFARVELKSAASQTQGDRQARSYVVHCVL